MRKRIEITEEQGERITKLREAGYNWSTIGKETGIPRHACKRFYLEWQQKRLGAEREKIRREAALEFFKEHMEDQVRMGERLEGLLNISRLPVPAGDAEEYLALLWNLDLRVEATEGIQPKVYSKETEDLYVSRKVKQQNRLIFRSLRDHTKEKLRWEALEEWQAGWDGCRDALQRLKDEATIRRKEYLDSPKTGEKYESFRAIAEYVWNKSEEKIQNQFAGILWTILKDSYASMDLISVEDIEAAQSLTDILIGNSSEKMSLPEHYRNMIELPGMMFVESMITDIIGSDSMRQLAECLNKMAEAHRELAEKLNPMVIRPLILGTRCALCPV